MCQGRDRAGRALRIRRINARQDCGTWRRRRMSLGKRMLRRRPGQQTTASRRTTVAQKDFGVQVVRHGHNVKHQDHDASESGPFLKRVSLRRGLLTDPAPLPNPKGNDDEQHPDQIEKCLHRRFAMIRDVRRVEAQTPELISAVASSSETQMYHRSPMAAILWRRGSYARIITARKHATASFARSVRYPVQISEITV